MAEARLALQKISKDTGGAPRGGRSSTATAALEKQKKRKGGSGSRASKCPKLLEQILSGLPLRGKVYSEDEGSASSTLTDRKPISAAALAVEYSELESESDDDIAPEVTSAAAVPWTVTVTAMEPSTL